MHLEIRILRDVTERLGSAGIRYMLTGSFALNYYAAPRMTRDIDLVVALEDGDIDKVVALFERDYYIDRQAVLRAVANRSLFNIIHFEHAVKVDFILSKRDRYNRVAFDRRQKVTVDDSELWMITKEDLIISKLLWARDSHSEFQLRDVKNLLMTGYDAAYVERWAAELVVNELLDECLK